MPGALHIAGHQWRFLYLLQLTDRCSNIFLWKVYDLRYMPWSQGSGVSETQEERQCGQSKESQVGLRES